MGVTRCRSCNAPVIWAITENGKAMPVDSDATDDGDIYIEFFEDTGRTTATIMRQDDLRLPLGGKLRKSHFATCPQGKTWRHTR